MEKRDLRKIIRELKSQVSPQQMLAEADVVFSIIEKSKAFINSSNILLYYSLPDELPTHTIVEKWSKCKNIFLPRVQGNDLEIVPYDSTLSSDNIYHISEPTGIAVDPSILDLIIVPAMGMDVNRNRIGRGKGFYDRLLCKTSAYTIGVGMNCQLFDDIPVDTHDVKLDAVVTETKQFYKI